MVFSKKIKKKIFDPEKVKKRASKVAHNRPRPFYLTVQPRPQPTAQNWFFILWNLGTRHLFSYLWVKYYIKVFRLSVRCFHSLLSGKVLSENSSTFFNFSTVFYVHFEYGKLNIFKSQYTSSGWNLAEFGWSNTINDKCDDFITLCTCMYDTNFFK